MTVTSAAGSRESSSRPPSLPLPAASHPCPFPALGPSLWWSVSYWWFSLETLSLSALGGVS